MRRLCESFQRIDVRRIDFRLGTLWQYPKPDGLAVSLISNSAHVIHDSADFYIQITRTPCNYGGGRPWFRCPRCERRCAILYDAAAGDSFGCRKCLRLTYASESEDTFDRLRRKGRNLAARLCAGGEKPKWMRMNTFERIHWRRVKAERDAVFWLTRRFRLGLKIP